MESIFEGTWASGPWPDEVIIADVLLETGWTWTAWCETPPYIRTVVVDLINTRRKAQQAENDRQQAEADAQQRHMQR